LEFFSSGEAAFSRASFIINLIFINAVFINLFIIYIMNFKSLIFFERVSAAILNCVHLLFNHWIYGLIGQIPQN